MALRSHAFKSHSPLRKSKQTCMASNDHRNRKGFVDHLPADDVGNKIDCDPIKTFIHDGVGNSLEGEPTHLGSGILTTITKPIQSQKNQWKKRENYRIKSPQQFGVPQSEEKSFSESHQRDQDSLPSLKPTPVIKKIETIAKVSPSESRAPAAMNAEEYIKILNSEFQKLLGLGQGQAFSILPCLNFDEQNISEEAIQKGLNGIVSLTKNIFKGNNFEAEISLSQFASSKKRFALLVLTPKNQNREDAKKMIYSLREVLLKHVQKVFRGIISVAIVLDSAEDTLKKYFQSLGAVELVS